MPAGITLVDPFAEPGMGTALITTEYEPFAGQAMLKDVIGIVIDSTAVDARSTPTTTLLRGLLLGQIGSTKKYKQYSATATDGSNVAIGYLEDSVNMLDSTGSAAEKMGRLTEWAIRVKSSQLGGLDAIARAQLSDRFIFDDDLAGYFMEFFREIPKTADYTVLASDRGTMFTNTGAVGAVNFTLPTLAPGLKYGFRVVADQSVTVTSAAGDDIVAFNDASADSVAFSTGGAKVGGVFIVQSNAAGTKWYVDVRSAGANTVTVTT